MGLVACGTSRTRVILGLFRIPRIAG